MAAKLPADLEDRLKWAVRIAQEAGELTLKYFRADELSVQLKADASPVTIADRQAEELLRRRIAQRFPEDAILGEELGETSGTSGFQWVLDPIDGTKAFIHGVPLYTTLVAVLHNDEPRLGVIHAPATSETVYAGPKSGCWYLDGPMDDVKPRQARVSKVANLKDGLLLVTDPADFARERKVDATEAFLKLQRTAQMTRTWADAYGYLMVATGRAEAMIDPVTALWDAAALQPVVEEAGGRFTDWGGKPSIRSGDAIATNGLIMDEVLAILLAR